MTRGGHGRECNENQDFLGTSEGLVCMFTLFRPIDVNCFRYSLASLSLKWSLPALDFCSFVCFLSRSIRGGYGFQHNCLGLRRGARHEA